MSLSPRIGIVFLSFLIFFVINEDLGAQPRAISQLFSGSGRLSEQYGISSHVSWKGYDYDNLKFNLKLMSDCGSNVVRTDFGASTINWGTNKMDFSIFDHVIEETCSQGMQLLPIVSRQSYKIYTKEYSNAYKSYLEACIQRYGLNVAGWEIRNEMDLAFVRDGNIPVSEYLPLLKDSYQIIKRHNSQSIVLLGAIGDINNNYFNDLLANNAADYFDVFSAHRYTGKNTPEKIVDYYQRVHNIMSLYCVNKPVWLTETGYQTYSDETDPDLFYTEILPKVYKQLGINCAKIPLGVLYDSRIKRSITNQDNKNIYAGFRSCCLISLDKLKSLSVIDYPVIMILFGERFPEEYFEDLRLYIAKGGTVVFPEGGAPLFYNWKLDTDEISEVGKKYNKKLHIGYMFSWDKEAKRLGIKKMQRVKTRDNYASRYSWREDELAGPRFLTDVNLHKGDLLIPIMEGTDGQNIGLVAACYKFNSDLKGNIIIQTRTNNSNRLSKSLQAVRTPRIYLLSYAVGVDKVFSYCLRDRNTSYGYGILDSQNQEKPVCQTLRTLASKLPEGSTRPKIKEYNNQYIASWITPSGKTVYCVWTSWVGQECNIEVNGAAKFTADDGTILRKNEIFFSPSVIYIEDASCVDFLY